MNWTGDDECQYNPCMLNITWEKLNNHGLSERGLVDIFRVRRLWKITESFAQVPFEAITIPHTHWTVLSSWHPPSYHDLDCHRTDRTPTSMAKREVSGEKGEVMAARTPCWLSEAVKDDFARPSYQQLTSLAAGGRLSPVDLNFTSPPCTPLKMLRFQRKLCLLDFLVMSPPNFSPISY